MTIGRSDDVAAALDDAPGARTGRLLSAEQCAAIVELYADPGRFRSTVHMARHRFGRGEYRYFARPLPEIVDDLRNACWSHLLPIARQWADRLDRPAPWPDDLDEWLRLCHAAGHSRCGELWFPCRSLSGSTSQVRTTPAARGSWSSSGLGPSPVRSR